MTPLRSRFLRLALGVAVACAAGPALAHPGHEVFGLVDGLAHPLLGLDHVLAMIAVGLWAALRGGRSLATWPATFLAAMAVGVTLGGLDLATLEGGVAASVVLLGALTAADHKGDEPAGLAIVAAAGLFHGMAHAADIHQAAPSFEVGMLFATALLHGAGLGAGLWLRGVDRAGLVRLLGAGVAASGLFMAAAG
jgi:urease accessory protein